VLPLWFYISNTELIPLISIKAMEVDQSSEASASIDNLSRARVATVISIVLVLKAHLKHLYGITEE
jgi:hypothetical protein